MKKAYFISDLHLGARYLPDAAASERRVVSFLQSIADDAAELYLVGDVLDYWFEYRNVVPRGFVRFFGQLARMADSGVRITWLIGNHDIWIFDYLPAELGISVVRDELDTDVLGTRFYMAHGDACGAARSFRAIRAIFRNRFCQKCYAAIHPRLTVPFALRWSRASRSSDTPGGERGIKALEKFSRARLARFPATRYFVFGHWHVAVRRRIAPDAEVVVLGDWIEHFTYACFDGASLHLRRWPDDEEITLENQHQSNSLS